MKDGNKSYSCKRKYALISHLSPVSTLQDSLTWLKALQADAVPDIDSDDASRLVKILQTQLKLQLNPDGPSSSKTAPYGTHESEAIRLHAAKAAACLTQQSSNRERLASAGLIAPLAGLLKIITDQAQLEAILTALSLLAQEQSCHKMVLKSGAVEPLLRFCHSETKAVLVPAAWCISELTQARTNWPPLMKAGLLKTLQHLLQCKSERGRSAAALAFVALGSQPANDELLREPHIVSLLVGMLGPVGHEHGRTAAALALQNLAIPFANKRQIAEAGAIPLLVDQLRTASSLLQEGAAGALMNLAQDKGLHEQLIAADACQALASALRSRNEYVQPYAAGKTFGLIA